MKQAGILKYCKCLFKQLSRNNNVQGKEMEETVSKSAKHVKNDNWVVLALVVRRSG